MSLLFTLQPSMLPPLAHSWNEKPDAVDAQGAGSEAATESLIRIFGGLRATDTGGADAAAAAWLPTGRVD